LFYSGIDMTRFLDRIGQLPTQSELNSAAPLLLLASDERRAPTAILSSAKRATLIACLNGGSLHKQRGVWTAPLTAHGNWFARTVGAELAERAARVM
jgi:hypothetical protein